MKWLLRLFAIANLAFAASCNHSASTPAIPGAPPASDDARPQTVHVIPFYSYKKVAYDAQNAPGSVGGLIGSETALYGATFFGGNPQCATPYNTGSETGCGSVYRLVPKSDKRSYKLDVLHTFNGAPADGAASLAALLADRHGELYGTTFYGGAYNEGTLFKLRPASSGYVETIVHSFGYGQDGAYPASPVIEVNRYLYGTTIGGGAYSNQTLCGHYGGAPNGTCGTVYRVDLATGNEQVLHSFGKVLDGAVPWAAPLYVSGRLYGTTDLGGGTSRCGTVFRIDPDGSHERVVHNFVNNPRDGCNPFSSLTLLNGTLYGTTCCGGGYYCSHCEGVIFSVDPKTGNEQVLHKFGNGSDGSQPVNTFVAVQGVLYGTTTVGGGTSCMSGIGCGTIFSYAPSAPSPAYSVLYDFQGKADGAGPRAPLLYSNDAFFATTTYGGRHGHGAGFKAEQSLPN